VCCNCKANVSHLDENVAALWVWLNLIIKFNIQLLLCLNRNIYPWKTYTVAYAKISKGGPKRPLPKFLENVAILCFERRFSKQNSVNRLKLNILVYTAEYCLYIFLFFESEGGAVAQWSPPPYASEYTYCIKQFTEKKTQRFICIQQVLCRNTIRPWCLVQGQLMKKWCQEVISEFNIPLKQSSHILTISEQLFAPPTNVGSDVDLFLLLTFCQNDFLVLSTWSAAARPLALCISTSLRHCRNEYLKSFLC